MIIKSTKFPNGVPVHIIPSEFLSIMSKDSFMWFIKELPVPTYFQQEKITIPVIFITQGFADYLKQEPDN